MHCTCKRIHIYHKEKLLNLDESHFKCCFINYEFHWFLIQRNNQQQWLLTFENISLSSIHTSKLKKKKKKKVTCHFFFSSHQSLDYTKVLLTVDDSVLRFGTTGKRHSTVQGFFFSSETNTREFNTMTEIFDLWKTNEICMTSEMQSNCFKTHTRSLLVCTCCLFSRERKPVLTYHTARLIWTPLYESPAFYLFLKLSHSIVAFIHSICLLCFIY